MEGRAVSKRQLKREYKGEAPHKTVSVISLIIKVSLQLLIFILIYTFFIELVREKYHNIFIEFLYVSLWLIIADLSAFLLVLLFKIWIIGMTDYILNIKKEKKNYNRKVIEYVFYMSFRSFSYVIGLTLLLVLLCSEVMPLFWAYLFVWFGIFITAKLFSKLISVLITKRIE